MRREASCAPYPPSVFGTCAPPSWPPEAAGTDRAARSPLSPPGSDCPAYGGREGDQPWGGRAESSSAVRLAGVRGLDVQGGYSVGSWR